MRRHMVLIGLLVASLTTVGLWATDGPPDQGVARVSFVNGEASYLRGDDANRDDWTALGVNTPLTTGDALYTAQGARAELTLGEGNAARLDGGTEVDVVSLTSSVTQLGLSSGRADLHVQTLNPGTAFEMDTPGGAATITAPGTYRFSADTGGSSFGVLSGRLTVAVNGQQVDVRPGENLLLTGTTTPTYSVARLGGPDAFDRWSAGRDARVEGAQSARYVNPRVNGYEDLDASGRWHTDPTYGRCWTPMGVPVGWAPYQDGTWIWQDPFGWTWVSYEPWGWAPYHYGRWIYASDAWCWVPPPPPFYATPAAVVSIQPFYAPAVVGFFGIGGSNWSLGVSLGFGAPSAVGWVPLAPGDPFFYPWQPAPAFTSVSYTNINVFNACTVVNRNAFGTGPVSPMRVTRQQIQSAQLMGSRPTSVLPTTSSLAAYPSRRVSSAAVPSAAITSRPLVARLTPPPRPASFSSKLSTIRSTGRPVAEPVARTAETGRPFRPGTASSSGFVSALRTSGNALRPASPAQHARVTPIPETRMSSNASTLAPERGRWTPRTQAPTAPAHPAASAHPDARAHPQWTPRAGGPTTHAAPPLPRSSERSFGTGHGSPAPQGTTHREWAPRAAPPVQTPRATPHASAPQPQGRTKATPSRPTTKPSTASPRKEHPATPPSPPPQSRWTPRGTPPQGGWARPARSTSPRVQRQGRTATGTARPHATPRAAPSPTTPRPSKHTTA